MRKQEGSRKQTATIKPGDAGKSKHANSAHSGNEITVEPTGEGLTATVGVASGRGVGFKSGWIGAAAGQKSKFSGFGDLKTFLGVVEEVT